MMYKFLRWAQHPPTSEERLWAWGNLALLAVFGAAVLLKVYFIAWPIGVSFLISEGSHIYITWKRANG